jgi:FMN phosphatase YigB (HAD superfamily)
MKGIVMKKEKIILTDCDGAILDWEWAFHNWMEHHGHTLIDPGHYQIGTMYGISLEIAKTLVRTFNESAAIGFLPPLRDAQYFIKKLHEQHQYKFICITSLSLDPHAQKLRERNLAKIFGPNTFKEVVCLDCGADKDEVLAEYGNRYKGCIWVEDKPENADVGAACGLDSIVMEHAHNMNYSGPAMVMKNWEEIYKYVVANI